MKKKIIIFSRSSFFYLAAKSQLFFIFLIILIFSFISFTNKQEEKQWTISAIYDVNEFNSEAKNLYIDEQDNLYVDYINKKTKELCLDKFDRNRKKLLTIKTGYYVSGVEEIFYGSRDELLGFIFKKDKLILVTFYNILFNYYDLNTGKLIKKEPFNGKFDSRLYIEEKNKNILTSEEPYDKHPYNSRKMIYEQFDIQIEKDKILFFNPMLWIMEGEDDFPGANVKCFTMDGKVIFNDYIEGLCIIDKNYYELDKDIILPDDSGGILPIFLNKEGKLVLGFSDEEMVDIDNYYEEKSYQIYYDIYYYLRYITRTCYVQDDDNIWTIYDIYPSTRQYFSVSLGDLVSSVLHLKKVKGKWKVVDSIGPFNIAELDNWEIIIDRVIRATDNKVYLWVRKISDWNLDELDYRFDREIWVLEKK